MKIKGKITMLINQDKTQIEIHDDQANTMFCKVDLTNEETIAILSRQGYVSCEIEVMGLDRVGKKHECKSFEFEIPFPLTSATPEPELARIAQEELTDGGIAEGYFRSQNSFFKKDGKQFARCTIRRYI